jgi:hypothetical protein
MAMGYQGLAQIEISRDGTDGFVPLLIEGSSINMVLEPIYSEAVWGAGWYNAATNVNYADNAIRYEGGLDFQLQASANVWNLVRDWAIEYRAFSRAARITPDASWVYYYGPSQGNSGDARADYNDQGDGTSANIVLNQGRGRMGLWCRGLSLSTSEASFVTGSIDTVALFRQAFGPGETSPYGTSWADPFQQADPDLSTITNPAEVAYIDDRFGISGPNNPLNPIRSEYFDQPNFDPIPYWRTIAYIRRSTDTTSPVGPDNWANLTVQGLDTETVEWSVDLTNNTQVLYTCRGVRGATAVLQGSIDATGSVTLYNPYGLPDPVFGFDPTTYDEFNPFLYADNTEFIVQIVGTGASSNEFLTIALPAVVVEGDDYGVRGQNDVTNRTYTIKGLGGRLYQNLDSNIDYTPTGFGGPNLNTLSLPPMIMTEAPVAP